MEDIKENLKRVLSQRNKVRIIDSNRLSSAVLIPLYYQNGEYHIIFTRRTHLVKHHKGEISFPGGGCQPEDSTPGDTALRESYEEIGLEPGDAEMLGELDDAVTGNSNYVISPFVAVIRPQYAFKLNEIETAEIIDIPVLSLLAKGCRRDKPEIDIGNKTIVASVYYYEGNYIIGATARILKQFLEIFARVTGQTSGAPETLGNSIEKEGE